MGELTAHPLNWRKHPKAQASALTGALREVGLVQSVIWNRRTKRLVDGHLRVELAMEAREATLPVTVVDLSEDEERTVLATLDPIGAMAIADGKKLNELLDGIKVREVALLGLIEEIRPDEESFWGIGDAQKAKRTDVAVSLRVLCSEVQTIEAAMDKALLAGASTRGSALRVICEAYLAQA